MDMEKLPDLKTLTSDEKDVLIVTLYELVVELRLIIQQQAEELEKIKGQLCLTITLPSAIFVWLNLNRKYREHSAQIKAQAYFFESAACVVC